MATDLPSINFGLKEPTRVIRRLRPTAFEFDSKEAKYLIVKLPSPRGVTILFLSMLMTCFIVLLSHTGLRPAIDGRENSYASILDYPASSEMVPVLISDLSNGGLLRTGHKALFMFDDEGMAMSPSILRDNIDVDVFHVADFERQSSVLENSFDFIFTCAYQASSSFIDKTLKMGGVLVIQLSQDPSEMFEVPENYRIAYFRKFEWSVIAMKRLQGEKQERRAASAGQRRLMGMASEEEKKAALKNLEDVLLEPPRAASRRSSRYLKKTRYLPDLMGDKLALDRYPRRVFIDVKMSENDPVMSNSGSSSSGSNGWFARNYPTRNLEFEKYAIEVVGEESQQEVEAGSGGSMDLQREMSEWLRGNVREEEYVVMKAEAEVVEEMVRSRTIRLVDELFLECKPRGSGKRAYWECLALYGRIRDEGIAVHQWWG
ncbi:hypothetical protein SAY87_014087 [Trapa incisa]|uniref:DUF7870 domain-containing protein n=1 Tax=Trapa incisa TaxID=236973 RepID=A0AAN7JD41_9MYRT|nr:hypothetical protein SAY87_014087 [Trapa incisa]